MMVDSISYPDLSLFQLIAEQEPTCNGILRKRCEEIYSGQNRYH
ncbi:hypothetical protein ES705_25805 [subsurface metagenome]